MRKITAAIIAFVATLALAFGISAPASAAAPGVDLTWKFVSTSGPVDAQPQLVWIADNTTATNQLVSLTYNDESGATLTTDAILVPAGQKVELTSGIQVVKGNAVTLKATLYQDGKKVDAVSLLNTK